MPERAWHPDSCHLGCECSLFLPLSLFSTVHVCIHACLCVSVSLCLCMYLCVSLCLCVLCMCVHVYPCACSQTDSLGRCRKVLRQEQGSSCLLNFIPSAASFPRLKYRTRLKSKGSWIFICRSLPLSISIYHYKSSKDNSRLAGWLTR